MEEFNRAATQKEIEMSRWIGEGWERRERGKEQIIISDPLSLLSLGYGPIIPNTEFAKWAKDHPDDGSYGKGYNGAVDTLKTINVILKNASKVANIFSGGCYGITHNFILSLGGIVEGESFVYWNNKEKSMGFDMYLLGLRAIGFNVGHQSKVGLFIDISIGGPLFTVYADTSGSGQFDLLFMTYNQGEFAEGGGNFGSYLDNVWGYNVGLKRDAYKDEIIGKEHKIKDYPDELGYMHDHLLGRG